MNLGHYCSHCCSNGYGKFVKLIISTPAAKEPKSLHGTVHETHLCFSAPGNSCKDLRIKKP